MSCCHIAGQRHRLRLHGSRFRRALAQTFPPCVEGALLQVAVMAECANRLTRCFLLADPLAPQLAAFYLFPLHASTMPFGLRIGQRGLCDAYSSSAAF
jgi:hypothetical protein